MGVCLKKRGQISIFIIVGVLLLLVVGSVLYLRSRTTELGFEAQAPRIAEVPTEFQAINSFVQQCLRQTAEDGLILLGERGGLIYTDEYFPSDLAEPTESDAVAFSQFSEFKIPYWYYMASDNECTTDCSFGSQMPELFFTQDVRSVEGDLDRYVRENLDDCIDDFSIFANQGYTISAEGGRAIETNVLRDSVRFHLIYPVQAEREGSHEIDEYLVEIPVDLQSMYEIGRTITTHQAFERFLEGYMLSLLYMYGSLDEGGIPPIEQIEIKHGQGALWIEPEVEERVSNLVISPNIQLLTVENSNNFVNYSAYSNSAIGTLYARQNQLELDLAPEHDTALSRMNVKFVSLPQWEPYFDLNCNGALCTSDSISSGALSLIGLVFGVQRYQFQYDYSTPVMVTLEDPTALNGRGYTFQFMIESNIRQSQAVNGSVFEAQGPEQDTTLLCNRNQFDTSEITVDVVNKQNRQPVDGATIQYVCADETCQMGITEDGMYTSEFPRCIGGFLLVQHPDYADAIIAAEFEEDDNSLIEVELQPKIQKEVIIRKKPIQKNFINGAYTWTPDLETNRARNLDALHEFALVELTYIDPVRGPMQPLSATYNRNDPLMLELIPGEYDIQVIVFTNDSVIVEPQERCTEGTDVLGITIQEEVCVDIPEEQVVLNQSVSGGFEGRIIIEETGLTSDFNLVLYALGVDLVRASEQGITVLEDLGQMGSIREYSTIYEGELQPTFEAP